VVAELGGDAGGGRAPADHRIGVCLREHRARELAGAAPDRAEQRPFGIVAQAGAVEIGGEIFFEVVMARHRVALAALLAQPHPEPAGLRKDILDRHAERRADPGEGIDHEPDQRAITQTGRRRGVDAVEQRARFRRIEYRRLPGRHVCSGANEVMPRRSSIGDGHASLDFLRELHSVADHNI
jgi:hypothetical protein